MNNAEVYVSGFFVIIGGIVVSQALFMEYYGEFGPGPGLLPLWVGGVMIILSLINLVQAYKKNETNSSDILPKGTALKNVVACIGSYVLFMLITDYIGFVISSILMLTILFSRGYKWQRALGMSIAVTVIVFVIFGTVLGVPLPVNEYGW